MSQALAAHVRDRTYLGAVTPASVMALIDSMRDALHEVEEPREAAQLINRADAIRYLSEKAGLSQEVQNQAAEVALRARRRAGELLAESVPHEGGRPKQSQDATVPVRATLADLGLNKTQSSRWQAIASLPEDRFETYIAESQTLNRELTTAGAVAMARGRDPIHREEVNPNSGPCPTCGKAGYVNPTQEAI